MRRLKARSTAVTEDLNPLPLRLADRFFLASHMVEDRLTAKIDRTTLAYGCAGALLAELLLDDVVALNPDVRPAGGGPTHDFLCWVLLREVRADPGRDLQSWLDQLATTATAKVRARLTITDVIKQVTERKLRGASPAWAPVSEQASAPAHELSVFFATPGSILGGVGMITVPRYIADATMAGLAHATRLLVRLDLVGVSRKRAVERVESWRVRLPGAYRNLINEVEAACLDAAIVPR